MTGRHSIPALALMLLGIAVPAIAQESDPDLPAFVTHLDKGAYLEARQRYINDLLGQPDDPDGTRRLEAVRRRNRQESMMGLLVAGGIWRPIGPAPIPNGQTFPVNTLSGRISAIVVHPTNPNIVYVGAAQGGVYRSLDGGASWTPIFDGAASLAIGALALAPSNPSILYVGTGEAIGAIDGFFGVGVYRVDNADTAPVLNGPINPLVTTGIAGTRAFTGASISRILVHPTDAAKILVSTRWGYQGLGEAASPPVPPLSLQGLYRSANATASSPSFEKVTVTATGSYGTDVSGNRALTDMTLDPANPNVMVTWLEGFPAAGDGGLWRTANAWAATPTFSQVLVSSSSFVRGELSAVTIAGTTTMVLADGETGPSPCTVPGAVRRSVDGGLTWSAPVAGGGGFCNNQCSYDIAVAVDPSNAARILLGGASFGYSTCARPYQYSTNSGTSFTESDAGLHADTQALAIAPSSPNIVYLGSDGGVFKSTDGGVTWSSLNNGQLSATQFQSIAVHPTDQHFTIGGSQDNGTHFWQPGGVWKRCDTGDGGFTLIDRGATNTATVTMYHTYYSAPNFLGLARVTKTVCATDGQWVFRGAGYVNASMACEGVAFGANNGIAFGEQSQFYPPIALGPGTPNTVYFGTTKLYRSVDKGDVMTDVSGVLSPGWTVSAIGIAPTDDNVRLVATHNSKIFCTTTGGTPTDITPAGIPAGKNIARFAIDPTNSHRAFVAIGGFNVPSGQHVWRSNDLTTGAAGWASAGNGLPDVPVNALVIDPSNSNTVYAGTDVGVYYTSDAGANWAPYGTGLPVVAVFDMAIQAPFKVLRIATHGRGMWQVGLSGSTIDVESSLSFVGAEFLADCAQITWHATREGVTAVVHRRPIPGDWAVMGPVTAGPEGNLTFEDRDLRPGGQYEYAVGMIESGVEQLRGDVVITVPRGVVALALGPNPSQGRLRASFSLPHSAPATLDLLDVAGRVIESHAVGSLGAGDHQVELARARALTSGIYWVKLTQDGRSTTRRFALTR